MCVESLAFRDVLDLVSLYRRRKWQAETRRPPPRLSGPRTSLPKERPQLTKTNNQTNKRTNERNRERKTEKRKHRTPERKQKKQNKKNDPWRARATCREKNQTNPTEPNRIFFVRPDQTIRKQKEANRNEKKTGSEKQKRNRQTGRQAAQVRSVSRISLFFCVCFGFVF